MEFVLPEELIKKIELKEVLIYSFSILLIILAIVSLPTQSYGESCVSRCINNNKDDLGSCLSDCSKLFSNESNLNSSYQENNNNIYYYELPFLAIITIILILALFSINFLFIIKTLYYSGTTKEEMDKVEIKFYEKLDS